MNWAHMHIALNHAPVMGVIFGLLLLGYAVTKKKDELIKVGFIALVVIALAAIPAYVTGDPAEDQLKPLPAATKALAERHEKAALVSLVAIEILGALALAGLFFFRYAEKLIKGFAILLLVLTLVASGLMAWTANLGGQIRHPEIRSDSTAGSISATVKEGVREEESYHKKEKLR